MTDPTDPPDPTEVTGGASPRTIIWLAVVLVVIGLALLIAVHVAAFQHWAAVHSGTDIPNGQYSVYYNFWSGIGSDLGEITLVTGLILGILGFYKHHNCHVEKCRRLGRPVPGTPMVACWEHHPEHTHHKRNVPLEHLQRAYREAQR